jgi:hypothetical protein
MTKAKYEVALLIRLPEFLNLSLGKLIRSAPTSKYTTISLPYTTVYLPTTTVYNTEFVFRIYRIVYPVDTSTHAEKLSNAAF